MANRWGISKNVEDFVKQRDTKCVYCGVVFSENDFSKSFGVGIKCGKESHGLECMDWDDHFKDAKTNLSQFLNIPEVKEIYETYKLPIQSTQNGGFHLLYRKHLLRRHHRSLWTP